ncbi:MAG: alpha/beta hydrolase [Acidobacteriota bacterium]|jgi:pimeloyl-ACP methyl ester carboxylesterase|nr:alpha/beta hydrolase [Acidobacteriota bacterium]
MVKEPISQFYYSHRLKLHFWDWGGAAGGDGGSKPVLVLVHGARDHARSWDRVAEAFAADFRVIAPDLRGHGDSDWATGAMYGTAEYILDLAALVDILGGGPCHLVGHSMGAAAALQYAGIYPGRVARLVAIEGFSPPPHLAAPKPLRERLRNWIEGVRECERRTPHRYPGLGSACERMMKENPYLAPETARHLTLHGSNWNPDGTLTWKFDSYMRAPSPYSFRMDDAMEIWRGIRCPVLLFRGLDSWSEDPAKAGRIQAIADYRLIEVPTAGHWVHHDQPEVVIDAMRRFFGE